MDKKKSLRQYVYENKKEYKYTLKFALPEMTDDMIDCIEKALGKYEFVSAGSFKSTSIQMNPLDFANVANMPVHISDIVLAYPATIDAIRSILTNAMGIPLQSIVVYTENDPRHVETDLFIDRHSPEFKEKYVAVMDPTNPTYTTGTGDKEQLFGGEHNEALLAKMASDKSDRIHSTFENPLMAQQVVDTSNLPKDYLRFNKDLPKDDVGLFGRTKKVVIQNNGVK